jgi:hypothetical protein
VEKLVRRAAERKTLCIIARSAIKWLVIGARSGDSAAHVAFPHSVCIPRHCDFIR